MNVEAEPIEEREIPAPEPPPRGNVVTRFFRILGPGLVTGAADDDPSGVATYSVAGAQVGTEMLWTALITWPLMAAVQMMCARIGMVTGQGLASALREKFPQPLLILAEGDIMRTGIWPQVDHTAHNRTRRIFNI